MDVESGRHDQRPEPAPDVSQQGVGASGRVSLPSLTDGQEPSQANGSTASPRLTWSVQRWRPSLSIEPSRQAELEGWLAGACDPVIVRYPFQGKQLTRADVEWLLDHHDGDLGPVDWTRDEQRERRGLNLRGAILDGVDLSGLPLARLEGGASEAEWEQAPNKQAVVAISLRGATLRGAHLEGAILRGADLDGADLGGEFDRRTQMQGAKLRGARLRGALLAYADLRRASLRDADLAGAQLYRANLEDTLLRGARLQGVDLTRAHLEGALLEDAELGGRTLSDCEHRSVEKACKKRASSARQAPGPHLEGADLRGAFFNAGTDLSGVSFRGDGESAYLRNVRWGDVNPSGVDWPGLTELGEEQRARAAGARSTTAAREAKRSRAGTTAQAEAQEWAAEALRAYEEAVQANREVATILQAQGLQEPASRYAYRADVLQREVLRRSGDRWGYLGSWLLDVVVGYGYHLKRGIRVYLGVVAVFALLFFLLFLLQPGQADDSSQPDRLALGLDAFALSTAAFHGRGFVPDSIPKSLHPGVVLLASLEAFIGLVIEVVFIATLTLRLFGK